jgi:hypothetical protein
MQQPNRSHKRRQPFSHPPKNKSAPSFANSAPEIVATGQSSIVQTNIKIVTDVTITDPDDSRPMQSIQISSGYGTAR